MFRLLGLDHVVLRVSDVEKARHFYCEVLGCTVERHQREIGLLQLRAGNSLIDLVEAGGTSTLDPRSRNMDHFCLRVEDYDEAAIRAHLEPHGVRIGKSGSRYGAEGEGPSIYLYDPEGNMIELKGPPSVPLR
jgi:glyoxylase I family protein